MRNAPPRRRQSCQNHADKSCGQVEISKLSRTKRGMNLRHDSAIGLLGTRASHSKKRTHFCREIIENKRSGTCEKFPKKVVTRLGGGSGTVSEASAEMTNSFGSSPRSPEIRAASTHPRAELIPPQLC